MSFTCHFSKLFPRGRCSCVLLLVTFLVLGIPDGIAFGEDVNNFQVDGTLPFGDLSYIWTLFRRSPGGEPLPDPEESVVYMFFDTGASGILLSRETREAIGIYAEPNAKFVDVGVGGEEEFEVSESLYVALADYSPLDEGVVESQFHEDLGPWRMMLTTDYVEDPLLGEPIDIVGIPGMAGKSVVLKVGLFEFYELIIPYYFTQIMDANDPYIAEADIEVKVRFTNFLYTSHPNNSGPLPVLGYNPVIENIRIGYGGNSSTGDWLFDTGAQLSMIASSQAEILGLVDSNGDPIVTPEFYQPIGGIGGEIEVPVFIVDTVSIPTLGGFDLVYGNPYVGVLDIGIIDERTGEPIILDGIFGTNFLGYSYDMNLNIVMGPYDNIIFDTQRAILGFDVNDIYPVPDTLPNQCGDAEHPWLEGDINRDCRTDMNDLRMLSYEWLSSNCEWLNWNCAGCDLNRDNKVNLRDMALLAGNWLTNTWGEP